MYPYNRKTQLYTVETRAKEGKPNQNSTLAADRRLQELLSLAQAETTEMAEKYAALRNDAALAASEAILNTLYLDGRKHLRLLKEAEFLIFGTAAAPIPLETGEHTADTALLLEELLFAELDDIPFYRSLLFAMDAEDLQNIFFEILTDKQNHTAVLNHLYAKYFR